VGDTGPNFDAQAVQVIRHQLCGPHFPVSKLWILVNVSPPGNHFALNLAGPPIDLRAYSALHEKKK